jgi:acyl carrier protein
MSRGDVLNTLKRFLTEIAGADQAIIGEDSTIDSDLQMNSVTFVELQVALEEELGILIDPIAVVELNRVGDIVDYLCSLTPEFD